MARLLSSMFPRGLTQWSSAHPPASVVDDDPAELKALKQALAAVQLGVWEWNVQTNENRWSDAVWHLFGLHPSQHAACFESWRESIHPDDRAPVQHAVEQARDTATAFEVEWRSNPANGPVRWLLSRGQPCLVHASAALRFSGIVMDITDRKSAEAGLQHLNAELEARVAERTQALHHQQLLLQHTLDGIPGLVGYWRRDLVNLFANRTYFDWFQQSPEQIKGQHIRDLLGTELYAINLPYMQAALRGEPQRFERTLRTASGEMRLCDTHYLPDVRDGEVQGFLALVFDIGHVKRAEHAAAAAMQSKTAFLGNISHELRTPLNAMFGLAQVGERQSTDPLSARTFRQILDSGQHLLTLINDILDYSKIEAGRMTLHSEKVEVAALLNQTLSLMAPLAQAKGLDLIVTESSDTPQSFQGDAQRCAQVLLNLVSNAVKFTEQGAVHIDLACINQHLMLTVRDTGVGIPSEAQARLFLPFEQIQTQARPEGGTGLGLAITQRLVAMMGGDLRLDSTPDLGSTFEISLPLKDATAPDWRALSGLHIVAPEAAHQTPLLNGLLARAPRLRISDTLPTASQRPHTVLVLETALEHLHQADLLRLAEQGCRILLHTPLGHEAPLPSSLRSLTTPLRGPLSPLRVLHALQEPAIQPVQHTERRLDKLHILAAEDNPVNRLVLQQMLEQEGANVRFACDGVEALELVETHGEHAFDLVLCDIQMPRLDGYQTTEALVRMAPSLPVIGLTAHAFTAARQQAIEVGMVDYVTKPYMLDTLVHAILKHRRVPTPASGQVAQTSSPPAPAEPKNETDLLAMSAHFQDQPALLARLKSLLLETLPEQRHELEQACQQQDWHRVALVAHQLKGTALNIHAPDLSRWSVQTQQQARTQSPDTWDSAQALLKAISQLQAALVSCAAH